MSDFVEIVYDSFLDYQPSNYPYRIIRYRCNSKESSLKIYKKDLKYNFSTDELENYIKKINKPAKTLSSISVSNIISKYNGDERIINYTLNNKVNELHFDKEDEEYYFSINKIKEMLNDKNDK